MHDPCLEFSYTSLKFCMRTLLLISSSLNFKLQRWITLENSYMHVQQQAVENQVFFGNPSTPNCSTFEANKEEVEGNHKTTKDDG